MMATIIADLQKGEKMSDYISRKDILNLVRIGYLVSNSNSRKIVDHINAIPSADVRENVRGEWVKEVKHHKDDEQEYDYYEIKCSVCGTRPQKAWELTNYCPNCGSYNGGENEI